MFRFLHFKHEMVEHFQLLPQPSPCFKCGNKKTFTLHKTEKQCVESKLTRNEKNISNIKSVEHLRVCFE